MTCASRCTGFQSWSGGDTAKQTPSVPAQASQSSAQSIVANTLPDPFVNPLAAQPISTPSLAGSQRWISPAQSCNPWSKNSTLNGCITPQVRGPCTRFSGDLNVMVLERLIHIQSHILPALDTVLMHT